MHYLEHGLESNILLLFLFIKGKNKVSSTTNTEVQYPYRVSVKYVHFENAMPSAKSRCSLCMIKKKYIF